MGLTDFAPGEWVGVELDDPRGKNDGSVEGKRFVSTFGGTLAEVLLAGTSSAARTSVFSRLFPK